MLIEVRLYQWVKTKFLDKALRSGLSGFKVFGIDVLLNFLHHQQAIALFLNLNQGIKHLALFLNSRMSQRLPLLQRQLPILLLGVSKATNVGDLLSTNAFKVG